MTHAPSPLPPEHRRRWLVITLVVVVVAVGLIVGGPWLYARLVASEGREPLTLSTPAPTASATPLAATIDVEGTWQVSEGSQAGYRLGEVLSGEQLAVVGRTEQVTGTLVVEGGSLTQAQVVVDTGSIATDESARDAYFRRALDTSTYPEATFTLTAPVDVSAVGQALTPLAIQASGTLTFHGVSRDVVADLQVQRTAEGVEVAGQVPVTVADFGLDAPDLGFVTVEPTGSVELLLVLER